MYSNGDYPDIEEVKNDEVMFQTFKNRTEPATPGKLNLIETPIGVTLDAKVIIRCIVCNIDPLNTGGLCPAINDDWDSFCSLRDIAGWVNPKLTPQLTRRGQSCRP